MGTVAWDIDLPPLVVRAERIAWDAAVDHRNLRFICLSFSSMRRSSAQSRLITG